MKPALYSPNGSIVSVMDSSRCVFRREDLPTLDEPAATKKPHTGPFLSGLLFAPSSMVVIPPPIELTNPPILVMVDASKRQRKQAIFNKMRSPDESVLREATARMNIKSHLDGIRRRPIL